MTYNPSAGGGGGVADGDKGDISVTGGGTTWTIDPSVVSTSKMGGDVTAAGKALLDDADATAQRATLGLGTAATQNSTAFANASHTHAESDITSLVSDLAAKQPLDATLTALAGLDATTGLVEQTGTDTFTKRAMGVGASTSVLTRADGDGRFQPVDATLTALAANGVTNGLVRVTGTDTFDNVGFLYAMKATDQTAIGTAYADITSLQFSIAASASYHFHFYIIADSDATTTGIDVAVNGPAGATSINYTQRYWTAAGTVAHAGATAYDNNTASTGSNGTAQRIFEVYGMVRNGATAGTLAARIKREAVGSGPNVRAGSFGWLWKIA